MANSMAFEICIKKSKLFSIKYYIEYFLQISFPLKNDYFLSYRLFKIGQYRIL